MNTPFEDRPRIKAFRKNIIKSIPCFPNDKATRTTLEGKHLTDLLITYIAWRLRHVRKARRTVSGRERLESDPRVIGLTPNLDAFIKNVEDGEDLTPYLSLGAIREGYTPAAEGGRSENSWADKDFLLNVMGLHHFHLGMTREAKGHAVRTNEVLFASVTRDAFEIIGLFDHDAFERNDDGTMTPERARLWSTFDARQAANSLPGQLLIGGFNGLGITASGHPGAVVQAALKYARIIEEVEHRLDDRAYVSNLYSADNIPKKPKLRWRCDHLDLGLYDEKENFFVILCYGPN